MKIPHAQIEALLREAADQIVMPLWKNLGEEDVTEKIEGDLATTADTRCEAFLASPLTSLISGSLVLGEESVHEDPGLLSSLHTDAPVWVIDPLDGTRYFAAGQPQFAIMVCLIQSGMTIGAWILKPLDGILTSAERGCGFVRRLDGTEYTPVDDRKGLLCATNPENVEIDSADAGAVHYDSPYAPVRLLLQVG